MWKGQFMTFLCYADSAKPGEQQKRPASSPADKLDVNRKYDHEQHERKFLPHWAKDRLRIVRHLCFDGMRNCLPSFIFSISNRNLFMLK
jgi:hypothetical protein